MDLRQALFLLAAEQGRPASAALQRSAGLQGEPPALAPRAVRTVGAVAALLLGLGLMFWVAANWADLGRLARLGLLGAVVVGAVAAALARPALAAPAGLLAFLGTGALFASFGQSYQTGADPWQLFALWALLTLPLALGLRSDMVWTPWAGVVMVALSLWTQAHTGHRWRAEADTLGVYAMAWAATGAVLAAMSPAARRYTGAGLWAWRTALVLAVVAFSATALGALFGSPVAPHFALGVAVLALLALLTTGLLPGAGFDVFGLSAALLGLDTLLVCGLARWLFESGGGDPVGRLLLLGLAAAGLIAASVSAVLRLARRAAP